MKSPGIEPSYRRKKRLTPGNLIPAAGYYGRRSLNFFSIDIVSNFLYMLIFK